jgi:hypothetical protein
VAAVKKVVALVLLLVAAAIGALYLRDAALAPPKDAAATHRDERTAAAPAAVDENARDARTPLPTTATDANAAAAAAAFATIRGRCVADEDGRPLAGCKVKGRWVDPESVTGADGRFEVRIALTMFEDVRISADGRVPRRTMWNNPLPKDAVEDLGDVRMVRGFVVRGRVVDETGIGIVKCYVSVGGIERSARAGMHEEGSASAVTADDGSFSFDNPVPAGDWEAAVYGRAYREPFRFHVDASTGCPPLWIVATRLKHIRARVVDENGKPVAKVYFSNNGKDDQFSNDEGVLEFWSASPDEGSARILLEDTNWPDPEYVPPTVAWGTEDAQVLLHRAGGPLPIAVVDDSGAAVEEFAVVIAPESLARRYPAPLENGRHAGGLLTIPHAYRGPNLLRVVSPAPELLPSAVTRVEVTGSEREALRVVLERMRVCPVQVVTEAGRPIAGSKLEIIRPGTGPGSAHAGGVDPRRAAGLLRTESAEILATATTGADGATSLLAPRDRHDLVLRVKGAHLPVFLDAPLLAPGAPLRVVVTAGGILRGRVLLHGQAADRFQVRLGEGDLFLVRLGEGDALSAAGVAFDGAFVFGPRAAGRYRVGVSHATSWRGPHYSQALYSPYSPLPGTARDVELRDGETTEIELDPGEIRFATMRGRVQIEGEDPSGWVLTFCQTDGGTPHGGFELAADGSYTAANVLPGRWCAALSRRGTDQHDLLALFGDEFEVADGDTLTRDFVFVPRRLTLQLSTADGHVAATPSATAYVYWHGFSSSRPLRNGEVVLDPAPALPVQIGLELYGPWSEPVSMPQDRREHTATVVMPVPR